jgi:hypothetical protein
MSINILNITPQYPNQTFAFRGGGQYITLNLYWRGYINQENVIQFITDLIAPPNFYADIFVNNIAIIRGTPVIDRVPINIYTSNFIGYIVSIDSKGTNNANLDTLGISNQLYYIDDKAELNTAIARG